MTVCTQTKAKAMLSAGEQVSHGLPQVLEYLKGHLPLP